MTEEIRQLDPTTVERIAAGEVVERPASVVKELLENSLDADASRVRVAIEAGGTESIRVSDDGIGMDEDSLRRAVEKHTTSKISDIDDLERGLATLGFRGEALHAIGAVSRMTITSRPRGGDRGTELSVEGGTVESVQPAGCPEGTTVEVTDLFYNVPARRKYLSQDTTEFAHVNSVVTAYALANPDVAVELEHDGRETFATSGQGGRRETILSVYGREVAEAMIELPEDALPDGPLESVSGLVSHPETTRASREYLSTYVNGRYVTANAVRDAVVDAYGDQLASDRYPFAVLFVEIDPAEVDVNVHPRKMEVRYSDADAVETQVRTVVEAALQEEGFLRSSAPRGRSAPDQATISPSSSDEPGPDRADTSAADGATPTASDDSATHSSLGTTPAESDPPDVVESNSGATETTETTDSMSEASSRTDSASGTAGTDSTAPSRPVPSNSSSTPEREEGAGTETSGTDRSGSDTAGTDTAGTDTAGTDTAGTDTSGSHRSGIERSRTDSPDSTLPAGTESQRTLEGEPAQPSQTFEHLPDLRVLGQLHETYIVAEASDGMILIDQHAADERVNYERLRERFEGETTTQALAEPVELELTAREAALFETSEDALARLGFRAAMVDDRTVEVTTVPALVAESAGPDVVRDVLNDLVASETTAEQTVDAVADDLLADMACYPSITGNTSLTEGSVADLLSALDDCENPWACPHGRPVVIHIDAGEIDDRFERDYPGH